MKPILRVLALLLVAASAHAHKASDAYLSLTVDGARVSGRWDIALRDLELAVGLDANADGAISWGELREQRAAIDAYALSHLRISASDSPCRARIASHQVDRHTDGAYAVLALDATCASARDIALEYDLLFALDPQHRGLLRTSHGGSASSAVLSPAAPRFALTEPASTWRTLNDFLREGVWHIWIGIDHVLFLLCLLLPAVVRREAGRWRAVESARAAALDVLRVVTAFTLAHSITLALAALDVVALPSRWVESAIAASIVLAALDNLRPFLRAPRWAIAFGFGLVHGLGFASVLIDLGLPAGARTLALVAFNAGVELGQLAIVAAFLPLALALRRSALYPRFALAGGSLAVAALASVWLWERAVGA
ncbi:MAG: HupE/UreJ family protein [Deltaproteobacteria bacterium]|nr:HupE/UreJ family protein [Deltaproteobacteria bacterium]